MRYLDIIINTLDEPDLWPMDLDRDAEMICDSCRGNYLDIEDASYVKQLCWMRDLLRAGKSIVDIISLAKQKQQSLTDIIYNCENAKEVGLVFVFKKDFKYKFFITFLGLLRILRNSNSFYGTLPLS